MAEFTDRYWMSRDGLKLHYRDYAGRAERPPVICLHGLTRNARDFAALADQLAGEWRVLVPEMRGRGDSAYAKDPATYSPQHYVEDLGELLADQGIARFVAIGTSLGGLITFLLAMADPGRIAGAVINDIAPVLDPAGLERIGSYVGQARSFPTWMHAARALEEEQRGIFPDWQVADWLAMAKRVMTLTGNGRIVFDYDMKIAEPFAAGTDPAALAGLWAGVDALANVPALFLRGALSDLLSAETLGEVARRLPAAEIVTVPRVGHAPTLTEPEALAAIRRLLARLG